MHDRSRPVAPASFRRIAKYGLASFAFALGAPTLLSGCGGDDITCGAGTRKDGKQCVALSSVTGSGGAETSDSGSGGSGTGGENGTGGEGTGGSNAGGAAGGDAGTPVKDELAFAGIGDASPADPKDAGGDTPGLVKVSWAPAVYAKHPEAQIHYEIFQATAAGAENYAVPSAIAPPGSTSYTFQDLTGGTTYYFAVRAVPNVGNAVDTNTAEKSASPTFDSVAPTFTAGAKATEPAGPTSVKVSWDPATDDHTGPGGIVYRVYWSTATGGTQYLGAVSAPGATSAIVTGLPAPETDYFFRVKAVDAAGNVDANKVDVKGTTGPDTTPPVFGGCTAVTDISAATATISWSPATDETTPQDQIKYVVYASEVTIPPGSSLAGLKVGEFTGGLTSGKVVNLIPATHYRFICRAQDAKGNEDSNFVIQTGSTSNDPDPPTFAGIADAVPDENSDVSAILVTWNPASDKQSQQSNIRYRVYVSLTAGDEDYVSPAILETTAGATQASLAKSTLPTPIDGSSNRNFFFVVRAVDEAGNEDANKKELEATTLVSFKDEVQPVFNDKCARPSCHTAVDPNTPPKQGQNLDEGAAYLNIVDVVAVEGQSIGEPNIKRVAKTGNLNDSYMYRKVKGGSNTLGVGPITGSQMPAAGGNGPLTPDQLDTLVTWIQQGARNN
ncbi:MAG TPA: fibronectin type III domain-containing protein [Polyangiaceae bacterium]|nr:fibronectin type III domain-containing protein [Polyangiaceae bacterium]